MIPGDPDRTAPPRLNLLDGFALLRDEEPACVPPSAQRVLAFLAVERRPLARPFAAGVLWPEATEERAAANLRSALWRVQREAGRIVLATSSELRLAPDVRTDLDELGELAARPDGVAADATLLTGRLLPGWYDEWVVVERERIRQLQLHALERLAERLTEQGRFGEAVVAGLTAVRADPLRESSHRTIIRAHLAEGNATEALRHYWWYRELLARRGALGPSRAIDALVRGALAAGGDAAVTAARVAS